MSTALLVLPHVWATADTSTPPDTFAARKGPHRLRLVRAEAAPSTAQPATGLPVMAPAPTPIPNLAFYRKFTEALLARYMSMSIDMGRVPSLMGRELFPGHVSHSRVTGFDDVVHFVHDVAACLKLLSPGQQYLVRRIAMHGYSQPDVAAMLGISLSTVIRRYNLALDRLTSLLIERSLLQPAGYAPQAAAREPQPSINTMRACRSTDTPPSGMSARLPCRSSA